MVENLKVIRRADWGCGLVFRENYVFHVELGRCVGACPGPDRQARLVWSHACQEVTVVDCFAGNADRDLGATSDITQGDLAIRETSAEFCRGKAFDDFPTIPMQRDLTFGKALVVSPFSKRVTVLRVMNVDADGEGFGEVWLNPAFDERRWPPSAIFICIEEYEGSAIAAGKYTEPATQGLLFEETFLRQIESQRV